MGQRDQSILKLQTDLSQVQEKYASALEEKKIERDELERLNDRVRQQSAELDELRESNDALESRRVHIEKELKQTQYDYETSQQELAKRDKQIESLKAEWTSSARAHDDEMLTYKQSYRVLSDELTHTKNELVDVLSKIEELKLNAAQLNNELAGKSDECESAHRELARLDGVCRDYENKLYSYTNDLSASRGQLDNVNAELAQLNTRLAESEGRYERALDNIAQLEHNIQFLDATVQDYTQKVQLCSHLIQLDFLL